MSTGKTVFILFLLAGVLLRGYALPENFTQDQAGNLTLNGLRTSVTFYNTKWQRTGLTPRHFQSLPSYPVMAEKLNEFQGFWKLTGEEQRFALKLLVQETAPDAVRYSMKLSAESAIRGNLICFCINLPVKDFDGKYILVNHEKVEVAGKRIVMEDGSQMTSGTVKRMFPDAEEVVIEHQGKKIELKGKFHLQLVDGRTSQVPQFVLRFYFNPSKGIIKDSAFEAAIRIAGSCQPLRLADAGKPAQPPARLKAMLTAYGLKRKETTFKVGTMSFDLSSGLILQNRQSAAITIPPSSFSSLHLLYRLDSADGAPALKFTFSDGSEQVRKLIPQQDFSVEIPSRRMPNGAVVTANNKTKKGLYYSCFKFDQPGPVKITMQSGRGRVFIAGATLGDYMPLNRINSVTFLQENPQWAKLEEWRPTAPGSALDFSVFLDAPAGKYGWLKTTPAGHFEPERAPGKRIRLYGANLCFSALYPDKKDAEKLADDFARTGYNSVRFHHMDRDLSKDPKDSKLPDPELLDKLDYLFYCFKKRGLYITADVYSSRRFKPGDLAQAKGAFGSGKQVKQLIRLTQEGRDNWKAFAKTFFGHRNPYTGLTWAEDPALYSLCLVNEDFPFNAWQDKELAPLELNAYKKYLEKRGLFTEENFANRGKLFEQYVISSYLASSRELSGYLRKELGYRGVILGLNHREFMAQREIRDHFDAVDTHSYWDHPYTRLGQGWGLPRVHNQTNILRYDLWTPRRQFSGRHFGKPYLLTELNYTFPNRFRAQFGPIIGAYAALQDWDALYRFAWSHRKEGDVQKMPIWHFDIAHDPMSQLSERIISLMFLQGAVKSAPSAIAWPFGPKQWDRLKESAQPSTIRCPVEFSQLGFYCRLGTARENSGLPGITQIDTRNDFRNSLTPAQRNFLKAPVKESETKEITFIPAKAELKVVTPKIESLTLEKGSLTGKLLSVRDTDTFQIVTAAALDGRPLPESRRILILHQSDVTNNNIRFASEKMQVIEAWGDVSARLIRRARASVKLALPGEYRLRALGVDGLPKAEVPLAGTGDGISFTADTSAFGGTMAYLLERK